MISAFELVAHVVVAVVVIVAAVVVVVGSTEIISNQLTGGEMKFE